MIRPPRPSEVLARYRTDKHGCPPDSHNYATRFYDHFLPHYRWVAAVLEVGVDRGESLRAWREFFPDAHIYGIDCKRESLIQEDRIHSVRLDASSEREMALFAAEYHDYFSVAIDDASHLIADQLLFVRVMKRSLRMGGLLVVEDVQSDGDARLLAQEGLRCESWDTRLRHDNRICYWIKEDNK